MRSWYMPYSKQPAATSSPKADLVNKAENANSVAEAKPTPKSARQPDHHVFGSPLAEKDLAMLEGCGIPRERARLLLWRRVDHYTGAEMFGRNNSGGNYAGILIPNIWPGMDAPRDYNLRRDHPDHELKGDGAFKERAKYVRAPGARQMLYFPHGTQPGWLEDPTLKIIILEGEKKAEALWMLGWHEVGDTAERPNFLPMAIPGVWNWKGTKGKEDGPDGHAQTIKGVIDDFERIEWKDREVIILFDSNVHSNDGVRIARFALAKELRGRGASVKFADVPAELGLNGIDDVAGQLGADVALKIIGDAYDPKKKAQAAQPHMIVAQLSEEMLARQYQEEYKGRILYDNYRRRWFIWNDQQSRWVLDETRLAYHYAREVCCALNPEGKKEFARAHVYGAVEQIAQTEKEFSVTSDVWDRNIWLLGTPGGTVDLRTATMRPAAREDYITKSTAVAPDFDAPMPRFTRFLKEITQGDEQLERYLQRIFGYSLTGSTREEKLFFLYGRGGNGKSKLVNTIAAIAGDYAITATMEAFITKRGEHHTTDIAMLAGARLVTASETREGRRWDEALINRVTGGDRVTARYMRRDNFTYTPQFTLIIVGNHAPLLSSVNEAKRGICLDGGMP